MHTSLIGMLVAVSLALTGPALAQQPPPGGMGGAGMGGGGTGMGSGGMGGPGMGGQPGHQGQGMMGQYGYRGIDRNGDGYISREELTQQQRLLERMQANWKQADRNGDGRVDAAEFSAFEQSMQ